MKREPITYTDGHFTSLMRAANWPPMYEPQPLNERELRAGTSRGTLAEKPKPPAPSEATRNEAIALGLRRYRNDVPCAKGHNSERYTRTRHCVECIREHNERSKQRAESSSW